MPNLMATPTNFPRRINTYCPSMAYSADVNYNGETRVNFGAPLAAVTTSILNAGSMTGITSIDLSGVAAIPDAWGRCIQIAASGANATVVTIFGWDYLGQPIAEALTLNGATPVIGNKAFKSFASAGITAAATTLSIGTSVKLGLPYKAIRCVYEIGNGVVAAAGTLVGPSLVDPQTNATNDPRGVYTTTTTMNGTNIISAAFNMVNDVNTSNNGGLHGLRQAAA
jgi:hypothetical protein